jgi:hypothetical protein
LDWGKRSTVFEKISTWDTCSSGVKPIGVKSTVKSTWSSAQNVVRKNENDTKILVTLAQLCHSCGYCDYPCSPSQILPHGRNFQDPDKLGSEEYQGNL